MEIIGSGIMLAGLLMGALTGDIWALIVPAAAGLLLAGAKTAAEQLRKLHSTRKQLSQYPAYRY